MKSKDQQLLEEAYAKVNEAGFPTGSLDRYGKFVPKSKWAPASDYRDDETERARNEERNANLEDKSQNVAQKTEPLVALKQAKVSGVGNDGKLVWSKESERKYYNPETRELQDTPVFISQSEASKIAQEIQKNDPIFDKVFNAIQKTGMARYQDGQIEMLKQK